MPQRELIEHRLRIGSTVKAMMNVGGYFEASAAEALDAAVLRDWIDRLQDWTPDAVRKAFWVWQDQKPDRRPSPAHILHILRDTHGRQVVAEGSAQLARTDDRPRQRVTPEAVARILSEVGGLPARVFKTIDGVKPTE